RPAAAGPRRNNPAASLIKRAYRKMRIGFAWLLSVGLTSASFASVGVTVDLLDPSDGISLPPVGSGIACVDVMVDVTEGDSWTVGAARGVAMSGATLRYAYDPNSMLDLLVNPGASNRFSTFISRPRPRDGDGRYSNGAAAMAGRYCPT